MPAHARTPPQRSLVFGDVGGRFDLLEARLTRALAQAKFACAFCVGSFFAPSPNINANASASSGASSASAGAALAALVSGERKLPIPVYFILGTSLHTLKQLEYSQLQACAMTSAAYFRR